MPEADNQQARGNDRPEQDEAHDQKRDPGPEISLLDRRAERAIRRWRVCRNGGRYWDRTSGFHRVKVALYR